MSEQTTPPPKRRRPPRPVTVKRVEKITEKLTRIAFGGEALAEFGPPRPGAHMKLFFVPEGTQWSPQDPDAPRPPSRTYTPLRYDPARQELEVEFVHHGDGLAASWAATAEVGEAMFLAGPGGGYDVPETATHLVLIADDTALPAAGTILEALPKGCTAIPFCEISSPSEKRPLSPTVSSDPQWLVRSDSNARAGTLLEAAIRDLDLPEGEVHFWIACESAAMRRIRDYLVKERGVDPSRLHTRGYWKLGESNYPDHDYGKD